MLRRGYNFVDGTNALGGLDAGLFFLAFVRDPRHALHPDADQDGAQRRADGVPPAHRLGAVRRPARASPRASTSARRCSPDGALELQPPVHPDLVEERLVVADHQQGAPVGRRAPTPARRTTPGRGCWSARRGAAAAERGRRAAAPPGWRGTARRRTACRPAARRWRRGTGSGPAGRGCGSGRRPVRGGPRCRRPTGRGRGRRAAGEAARSGRGCGPSPSAAGGRRRRCRAAWSSRRRSVRPRRPGPGRGGRARRRAPVRITSESVVSTTRPRGTSVAGRSTRMVRSSRSRCLRVIEPVLCGVEPLVVHLAVRRGHFSERVLVEVPGRLAHVGPRRVAIPGACAARRPARPRRGRPAAGAGRSGPRPPPARRRPARPRPARRTTRSRRRTTHRAVAQVADPVHPVEELAVVADHEQGAGQDRSRRRAGPGPRRRGCWSARRGAGRGPAQQRPGQPEEHRLATGQLAEAAVQDRGGQAEPFQLGDGGAPRRPTGRRPPRGPAGVAGAGGRVRAAPGTPSRSRARRRPDATGRGRGPAAGSPPRPATDTEPAVGAARRPRAWSSVDLPEPLAPTRPARPGGDQQVEPVERDGAVGQVRPTAEKVRTEWAGAGRVTPRDFPRTGRAGRSPVHSTRRSVRSDQSTDARASHAPRGSVGRRTASCASPLLTEFPTCEARCDCRTRRTPPTDLGKPVVLIAEELSPATVEALGPDFEIRHCNGADRAELLAAIADVDAILVRSRHQGRRRGARRRDAAQGRRPRRRRPRQRRRHGRHPVRRDGRQRPDLQHRLRRRARRRADARRRPPHLARPTPRSSTASGSGRSTPASSSTRRPSASSASAGSACSSPSGCRAFGMKVIAYDPYVQAGRAAQMGVRLVDLDTLLAEADFMSVHLPKTPETVGLIGAEQLPRSSRPLVLVNAARGGIVDEDALYAALKEGRIAAAGLDVFAKEPCTDSPLFELENVVATPHLGASTDEAQEKAGIAVARSVRLALVRRAGARRGQRPGRRDRRGRAPRHPAHREARPGLHRPGRRGRPAARRRGPRRDHRVRRQGARARRAQGRLHRHRRGPGVLRERAAARGRARHRRTPGHRPREPRPPQPDHDPRHPRRRRRRSR